MLNLRCPVMTFIMQLTNVSIAIDSPMANRIIRASIVLLLPVIPGGVKVMNLISISNLAAEQEECTDCNYNLLL